MQAMYGYNRPDLICPNEEMYCHYTSPKTFLKFFGMDRQNYWIDIAYLIGVSVLVRITAYYAVKHKLGRMV